MDPSNHPVLKASEAQIYESLYNLEELEECRRYLLN